MASWRLEAQALEYYSMNRYRKFLIDYIYRICDVTGGANFNIWDHMIKNKYYHACRF
jgi:hypothetical protein